MNKLVSILVPFFNEKDALPQIMSELKIVFDELSAKYDFETVLLDNHSTDGSHEIALEMASKDKNITVFRHSRNFGYQANILTGYANCKGDCAIQIDADGEDDPKLIHEFLKKWEENYQVVYGVRTARVESFLLTLQRKIFYRVTYFLSEVKIPVDAGDFRLVDRKIINILKELKESSPYLRGLLFFIGFNQIGIPYMRRKRYLGVSKFSWFDYIKLAIDAITSFSKKPLTYIAIVGLSISLLSFCLMAVYFVLSLCGQIPVKGFTTLILCIIFFSGVQLFCMGIVAIYIGRIFDEVKKRPSSILE